MNSTLHWHNFDIVHVIDHISLIIIFYDISMVIILIFGLICHFECTKLPFYHYIYMNSTHQNLHFDMLHDHVARKIKKEEVFFLYLHGGHFVFLLFADIEVRSATGLPLIWFYTSSMTSIPILTLLSYFERFSLPLGLNRRTFITKMNNIQYNPQFRITWVPLPVTFTSKVMRHHNILYGGL